MRRAVLTLGGTVAGLAALLSYKTHSGAAVVSAVGTPGTSTATSAATAPASTGPASATPSASAKAGHSDGAGGSASARTITGTVANTQYGPMQVQVTVEGKKITGVKVLQQTNTGVMSQQIDSNSIPQLTKETLTVQSARIDTVSGATATSTGYINSLQSALDKL